MKKSNKPIFGFLFIIASSNIYLAFSRHYSTTLAILILVSCVLFYLGKRWVRWPLFFCLLASALTAGLVGTFSDLSNQIYGIGFNLLATVYLFTAIGVGFFSRVDDWFSQRNISPQDTWNALLNAKLEMPPDSRTIERTAVPDNLLSRAQLVRGISIFTLALVSLVLILIITSLALYASLGVSMSASMYSMLMYKGVDFWAILNSPQLRPQFLMLPVLLIAIYIVFFVAPFLLTLPVTGLFSFFWRPATILLLRPFNRKRMTRPLSRIVRQQLSPFGHTYTLADMDIHVPLYVKIPVFFGQLSLFSFRLRMISRPGDLKRVIRAKQRTWMRSLNWCFSINKIFPVTCSDNSWQASVAYIASDVDLIVIDLTEFRENIMWELDLCDSMKLSDKVLFLADEQNCENAVQIAIERGKDVYLYNKKRVQQPLLLRRAIADNLVRNREPETYRAILKRVWSADLPLRGVIGFALGSIFSITLLTLGPPLSPLFTSPIVTMAAFFLHGLVGASILCSGLSRPKSVLFRIGGFALGFSLLLYTTGTAIGLMLTPRESFLFDIFLCFTAFGIVGMISTPFLLLKRGFGSASSLILRGGFYFGIGGIVAGVMSKVILLLPSPPFDTIFLFLVLLVFRSIEDADLLVQLMLKVSVFIAPTMIIGGLLGAFIQQRSEMDKDFPAIGCR